MKKVNAKKIVSWVGSGLMIISLGFLANRLFTAGMDFSLLSSPGVVVGLIMIAVVEGFGIVAAAANYHALIKNVSGIYVPRPFALFVYTVSNLYKYIPGGVLYVVGRNRLAVEAKELEHSKVALATIIEGVLIVLGAVLCALVFSFSHSINYVYENVISNDTFSIFLIITVFVLSGIAVPIIIFRKKISIGFKKFWKKADILKPLVLAKRFGFATLLMFLYGLTFVGTITFLGQEMNPSLAFTVLGLYLLAWLAGFLTPGAPSGLGIREAVMLMFLSSMVNESILLSAMVVHRIVTVVGDVVAYGVCITFYKIKGRQEYEDKQ